MDSDEGAVGGVWEYVVLLHVLQQLHRHLEAKNRLDHLMSKHKQ